MEVMMKELGEIITGNTPSKKTEEFWNSEDICFVKPDIIADNGVNEIVDSNEYISEDARKKARVVGKNSIFVTCIGSIGKIGIASDGEYAFNQQINAIIPNDRVQPKYLAYNLLFNKPRLVAIANAPVVPIINKSQFGEFTVNIETDIDRQCEIVDVLDKLTQIIQQRNKEISALDDLIKARFVEMFGTLHEDRFPKCTFRDVAHIKHGYAFSGEFFSEEDNGVVLVTPGNFALGGGFQEVRNKYFTSEYPEEYVLHAGDLIVTMTDLSKKADTLGYGAIVPNTDKIYLHNQRIGLFDKLDDRLNPVFVRWYMQTDEYRLEIVRTSTGSTVHHTSPDRILNSVIFIPPIELQNEFAAFVQQVDKSKVVVKKALDETQLLFDSLMQQYFG